MACFYMTVASVSGLVFGLYFVYKAVWPLVELSTFFLPFTIIQWMDEELPVEILLIVTHLYILPAAAFFCYGTLVCEVELIVTGKTDYEHEKNLHLHNTYSPLNNVKSAFGRYWYFSWVLPFDFAYKQFGDPTDWPNMRIVCEKSKKVKRLRKLKKD